jgi:hypothetical protein
MNPKPNVIGVLRRREAQDRHRGGNYVPTEAENGEMWLQAKECWRPHSRQGRGKDLPQAISSAPPHSHLDFELLAS